jgi:4-alpha-glucanotransferase
VSDPDAWGIESGFHDIHGTWHPAPPRTVAKVLEAMGAEGSVPPESATGEVWVVTAGAPVRCDGEWNLELEDGATLEGLDGLPSDLPLGYHYLERTGHLEGRVRLIVTPPSCHLPGSLRAWGWAAQLPATRSRRSWGIGDLADLSVLGEWATSLGAEVVLLNPLHAGLPGLPQEPSPYFASSRCFRNPLYLRVEDVPGAPQATDLERVAAAGQSLNRSRVIDRDEVWRLKIGALEEVWQSSQARQGSDPGFARYSAEQGDLLADYATFCVLCERLGRGWRAWPEGLRRPGTAELRNFANTHAERVRFHAWLQWLIDEQLGRAGETIGLVQDLAIGADPAGADAWLWQDVLSLSAKVGAPPDEFNIAGQDWGFPPFDPWKLRAAAFEPFIRVVRSVFGHAAGLRIDHVAGLFRLYWIPEGVLASEGAYVRYPWQEMLAILALESVRAGAWVVGEDLGTVEPYVREEMERRAVLSTKLVWFEQEPPARYPERSMAAVTTHDLPTVAGLWSRSDLADQSSAGVEPATDALEGMRQRLASWLGVPDDVPVRNVIVGTHQLLGQAPSAVILATLEDAQEVGERPNLPGTTAEERPNWSVALPHPLEDLLEDPLALNIAAGLERRKG